MGATVSVGSVTPTVVDVPGSDVLGSVGIVVVVVGASVTGGSVVVDSSARAGPPSTIAAVITSTTAVPRRRRRAFGGRPVADPARPRFTYAEDR